MTADQRTELVGIDLEAARRRVNPATFGLLCSLVVDLEGAPSWGEASRRHHVEIALAMLDPEGAPWLFACAPKGSAKTATAGAVLLSQIASGDAPPDSSSHLYAADRDQARLAHDSAAGFVRRTPGLPDLVDVQTRRIVSRSTGAQLVVEAADGASAHGLRPYRTVVDEAWHHPVTPKYANLLQVLLAGVPKVEGGRGFIVSTSGDPEHPVAEIYEGAAHRFGWSRLYLPGPTPGMDPDRLRVARESMSAAAFARLYLNQPAVDDSAALDPADVDALLVLEPGDLEYVAGESYVLAADLGYLHDGTAIVVAHREDASPDDPLGTLVVDAVRTWTPTPERPVSLTEVEAELGELLARYRPTTARVDRHQAVSMVERLAASFPVLRAEPVTAKLNAAVAGSLLQRVASRTMRLPRLPQLRSELVRLQLQTKPDGSLTFTKQGGANDLAFVIGWAAHMVTATRKGRVSSARGRRLNRAV